MTVLHSGSNNKYSSNWTKAFKRGNSATPAKPSTTKPATTKPATTKPATTKPATTKPAKKSTTKSAKKK